MRTSMVRSRLAWLLCSLSPLVIVSGADKAGPPPGADSGPTRADARRLSEIVDPALVALWEAEFKHQLQMYHDEHPGEYSFSNACGVDKPQLTEQDADDLAAGNFSHLEDLYPARHPDSWNASAAHPLHPDWKKGGYEAQANLGHAGEHDSYQVQEVKVTIGLDSLFSISEKDQTFKVKGFLRTMHFDCRLTHSLESIQLLSPAAIAQIWIPKIKLVNQVKFDSPGQDPQECFILPTGFVLCDHQFLGTFSSKFDFRKMPFDSQLLHVDLEARHDVHEFTLAFFDQHMPFELHDNELTLTGWHVRNEFEEVAGVHTTHLSKKSFSTLAANIRIRRMTRAYQVQVILPACLFWLLSYLGFWLPRDAVPARAATGVIPVLMLLNLHSAISVNTPDLDYLPWANLYVIVTAVFCTLNFCAYSLSHWAGRHLKQLAELAEQMAPGNNGGGVEDTVDETKQAGSPARDDKLEAGKIEHSEGSPNPGSLPVAVQQGSIEHLPGVVGRDGPRAPVAEAFASSTAVATTTKLRKSIAQNGMSVIQAVQIAKRMDRAVVKLSALNYLRWVENGLQTGAFLVYILFVISMYLWASL